MSKDDSRINDDPSLDATLQRLFYKAQQIRLADNERADIWEKIAARTRPRAPMRLSSYWLKLAQSLVIITIVSVGLVSAAANRAMPYDKLYPWKIGFNEALRSKLAISPGERGRIEILLGSKRLQEAESLSLANDLDLDASLRLKQNFDYHISKAKAALQHLAGEKQIAEAHAVSEDFEVFLESHKNIISKLGTDTLKTSLLPAVESSLAETAEARDSIESEFAKAASSDDSLAKFMDSDKASRAAEQVRLEHAIEKEIGL